MQWPWQYKVKTVYVPIPAWGRYNDLWNDKSYLQEAIAATQGRVYQAEITQLIASMRDAADEAQSPEALKAFGICIGYAKQLLTVSQRAEDRLKDMQYIEAAQKEADASNV